MPKKTKDDESESEGKSKIAFTFRVPPYLTEAWVARKKKFGHRVSNQAYLEMLVEKDLVSEKCIDQSDIDQHKEQQELSD